MAASSLVLNSITPNLYILGDNQKIFFSDPINNFSFINNFTPLSNVPTTLKIGIFNVFNNGYVFEHNTSTINNFGPLKLKSVFNNNSVDLLSIDNNIFTFNIPVIVPTPTLNNHVATKSYIDNKTWTVSQITNFNSSVVAFKLDQFAIPTANINLNNNKIINLATPVLATDAANKSFVESSVSSGISGVPTAVTLTGDVTGSGNTGSNITTTLNKRLDQISLPTASVNFNSQNITNLATPTLATHAVNKSYADSLITAQLSALSILSTTGIISRTATNTFATRSITTSTGLNITNGDGILGNPTISISTIPINNLANYPSNTSLFLRGDGTWSGIPSIDINSGTTDQLSIGRLSGYPANSSFVLLGNGSWGYPNYVPISSLAGYPGNSSYFLRGDGLWTTTGGGSASLSSYSINVNTDGGSTNWLRRSTTTVSGITIYGMGGSGFILENNNAESCGIAFEGYNDNCTIWTPGDSGSFLNIQDEDSDNSRAAYVATNGAWTQVSSQKRKHSIKKKNNNNVLDRFLKLSVKSYGYKYEIKDNYKEKKKKRIEKKSNKMSTGLILEELFAIFPNCIPDYYNKLFEDKRNKELILEEEIKNPENSGIDYNTLMCYFIIAFQEYVNKTDKLILELQNKVNNKKV